MIHVTKTKVYRRGNRIHFRAVRGKNPRMAISRERLVQAGVRALTQVPKDFQSKEGSVAEWMAFIISRGTQTKPSYVPLNLLQ